MEGTAATGGAVAATRSNPTFMVMHDGVHRNKDEQEDNKSYNERSHKDQLLCFYIAIPIGLLYLLYSKLTSTAPSYFFAGRSRR